MEWTQLFTIALGAILVNNFIVAQFLGICPFMGVSKKIETASGMGLAVIFVMGLASAICWPINELILVPMGLTFMQTVTYILVIASLVQFIEMFLKKAMPSLYEALGVYLPLITTNCAVLGVVLQNTQNGYGFIESVVYGVTGGIGFLLVIVIFASIRERMEFSEWPKAFEGFPIALVAALSFVVNGVVSNITGGNLRYTYLIFAGVSVVSALIVLLVDEHRFNKDWQQGQNARSAS